MHIPSLKKLARDNGLHRFDIGINSHSHREYYSATAWGVGIGDHGCTSAHGDTIPEAIANVLHQVAAKRGQREGLAA